MLLWLSVCLAGAVESKIRLVHGPYLQNLGPDEVTIVWLSDKPFCPLGGICTIGCRSKYLTLLLLLGKQTATITLLKFGISS